LVFDEQPGSVHYRKRSRGATASLRLVAEDGFARFWYLHLEQTWSHLLFHGMPQRSRTWLWGQVLAALFALLKNKLLVPALRTKFRIHRDRMLALCALGCLGGLALRGSGPPKY